MNADLRCDFISDLKSDPLNLICKLVWISFQYLIGLRTVKLINLCCKCRRNPKFLKVDHCLPHIFFLFYLYSDLSCHTFADPTHLRKSFWFFFDDPEGVFPEFFHNPAGKRCTNPFDRP